VEQEHPIIILGGGGHAKVLAYTLQLRGLQLLGYTDPLGPGQLLGLPHLGDDESIYAYSPDEILLVNGLGSIGAGDARKRLFTSFKQKAYFFSSVTHSSAVVAPDVRLGEGVQILAGAVINPGSVISDNTIVNTRACIDHDCVVGRHTHVAPGAVLSGGVYIGDGVHIGAGATIIQGITVGEGAVVGAGAAVVRPVPPGTTVVGVPAQPLRVCDEAELPSK
jgi:UDP-perosamine 4-acetyltransferase